MTAEIALITVASFLLSALLTGGVRKYALSHGVLDVPNARSSHRVPVPRGGGLAIVVIATVAWLLLALLGKLRTDLLLALGAGGVAVATVGFLDDRRRLSPGIRLTVHLGAAIWAMVVLGGLPPLQIGIRLVSLGWAGYVLGVLAIVWVLNLFNFMDGIDGIAGSEGVFMAWGGALLALAIGPGSGVVAAALVFGAACAGFLAWNWPPAKIFMGDVGSGYLGYVIAVLALAAAHEHPPALLSWLVLGGVFFVDATVTLIRRLARREPVYEAHRSHAYQWLARRWNSHLAVTTLVLLADILWLLPWAWVTITYPAYAPWLVACALLPLTIVCVLTGAGRSERTGAK